MSKENHTTKISRRDFLKLSTLGLGTMAFEHIENPRSTTGEKIRISSFPEWVGKIVSISSKLNFTKDGIILHYNEQLRLADRHLIKKLNFILEGKLEINLPNSLSPIPVCQTSINKRNLELIKEGHIKTWLQKGPPKAIVIHTFGDTPEWIKRNAPNETGEEFVKNGLGGKSVAFLVGSEKLEPNSTPNDKVSILQTEKRFGKLWPESGHASYNFTGNENPYRLVLDSLTSAYTLENTEYRPGKWYKYRSATALQTMSTRADTNVINRETLGIEVLGSGNGFYHEGIVLDDQKIANVLSLLILLGKEYKISGLDIMGHFELDEKKGDPGKEFLFQLRVLYGLNALVSNDATLINAIFGQFAESPTGRGWNSAIIDYFEFIKIWFEKTVNNDRSIAFLKKINFDQIMNRVKKIKPHDLNLADNQHAPNRNSLKE